MKQLKAELINAKSRALKPLELEISIKERLITQLEIEQQEDQSKLVELAQKGDGKAIQELTQKIAKRTKMLTECYDVLESLSQKYEHCSLEYNYKIDALQD